MQYPGEDNLSMMQKAVNYNTAIIKQAVSFSPKTAAVIVDFGSGEGYLSKLFEKETDQAIFYIEPAINMRHYYDEESQKRLFSSLNEFQDNSVDYLYSLNVLEHIEDDAAIIKEFERVLKPNGHLFLYLPAFPFLYSSMDKKVEHFRRYTKNSLKALFNETDFQIKECFYTDFLGFFATLLFKLRNKEDGALSHNLLQVFDRFIFPFNKFLELFGFRRFLGKNVILKAIKKDI